MHDYDPPLRHMRFVLLEVLDYDAILALPPYSEASAELVDAVLEEAARFAGGVFAPLNRSGDTVGCRRDGDRVTTPDGFAAAYRQYVENGWNSLPCPQEYGGQGFPGCVATVTQEMWQAANMALALCPMLTSGAIEAIHRHGTDTQKSTYLPRLVTGEWTGTMNLTEPQAGSDLGAVRTRAVPENDHFRLHGQKVFITWGEHDCADNIVHLVLARTPDAPPGVKGLCLFLVPKFLPAEDGSPGERNDVRCVGLEHKLGIHGSPTCTMSYGDGGGAIGYLVGEKCQGLAHMFTMMNEARHKVGVEGLSISDRALQQATAYARERIQGRPAGSREADAVPIIDHPDVRRMLLTMRAGVEAMRGLCYYTAWCMDLGRADTDSSRRQAMHARAELLTPIVKGWCTELGVELTSLGIQVHGGMGYMEENGAAQHFRDARITPIYEGTTAIQANDLVGRKTHRDGGSAVQALVAEMREDAAALRGGAAELATLGGAMEEAIDGLQASAERIVERHGEDPGDTAAVAVPYLLQSGYVIAGALMARSALRARAALNDGAGEAAFYRARILTARFYMQHLLPRAGACLTAVLAGGDIANSPERDVFTELLSG